MKAKELKGLTPAQLSDEMELAYKELFKLRMQSGSGQSPRPHLFSLAKKKIASIKTILNAV